MEATKRTGGRGRALLFAGAVAALACAAWSAAWFVAARTADQALSGWIAQEEASGRLWICPERRIDGFPTRIEIVCPSLGFSGPILDRDFEGSVGGFRAFASVFAPRAITTRIAAPFSARTAQGDRFTLDWKTLELNVEGATAKGFARLALTGEAMTLSGATHDGAPLDLAARDVRATLAPVAEAAGSYAFDVTVDGASTPQLAAALALKAPVDAHVTGTVVGTDWATPGRFFDRVERWRLAGGRVDVAGARLSSGDAVVEATGTLDLDEERRPRGTLNASLVGLEPTLRALGVNPSLIAAGSLLTSFLGGTPGQEDARKTIRLPLRLGDGALSIGPIRTPLRVPPLY
ncbi:DUF2125 domain-containing protein [Methylocella sp.]|uniref:DUF2125 domain-containing protein n=1 Tax=Methylocella sp. TaxID=1978226 RepID=UPI0037830292